MSRTQRPLLPTITLGAILALSLQTASATDPTERLFEAATQGTLEEATAALEAGADVNARDDNGVTPLMFALADNEPAMAELLIDQGADVEGRDEEGWSALMVAAAQHEPAVATTLIDHGADIEVRNVHGWTPLVPAALRDDPAMLETLVEHGADINTRDQNRSTPLMDAAAHNIPSMVEALLALGADPALTNKDGQTAYDFLDDNLHISESDGVYQELRAGGAD